jgi:hypothetical protein
MDDSKACTIWEPQNQLVLVAQQRRADGSIEFSAGYRPVPPHGPVPVDPTAQSPRQENGSR